MQQGLGERCDRLQQAGLGSRGQEMEAYRLSSAGHQDVHPASGLIGHAEHELHISPAAQSQERQPFHGTH